MFTLFRYMIRNIHLILFFFGSIFCLGVFSQSDSAIIVFPEPQIDFGYVYEADGIVKLNYRFENQGKGNLIITRVISSSMNVDDLPQKPVLPGKSGNIVAELNPVNRSGNFSTKLLVFCNAVNSPVEISAKGKILSGSIKGSFKYSIGDLAFRQSQLNFGYVYMGEEQVRYIPVLNNSAKWQKISFRNLPSYLYINPTFDSLEPGKTGMIEVCFNSDACGEWDFIIAKLDVEVKSAATTSGQLTFTANIRENFTELTPEEKMNAPIALIPIKVFNFDTIHGGETRNYDFQIKNEGGKTLIIRAVKPTCGCTAAMPEKTRIEPGESTHIQVSFDATGFSGLTKKGVTVITNDPENYKQFLWVSGYIR